MKVEKSESEKEKEKKDPVRGERESVLIVPVVLSLSLSSIHNECVEGGIAIGELSEVGERWTDGAKRGSENERASE